MCRKGVLEACDRLSGVTPSDGEAPLPELEEAAKLRNRGKDGDAARLLAKVATTHKTARVQAELGLAYQGSGNYIGAERLLVEALDVRENDWISDHRSSLHRALKHAQSHLGWLVLECTSDGEVGNVRGAELRCDVPHRVEAASHVVELRAPGHQSIRKAVAVPAGERAKVSAVLLPFQCESPGMLHIGGAEGGCCLPGQSWEGASCSGTPTVATGVALGTSQPAHAGLALLRIKLLGGVTNFLGNKSATFRTGVDPDSDALVFGPRAELRVGLHIGAFLTLEAIAGGTRGAFSHWSDCESECVGSFPVTETMDCGAMLQGHTNRRREGGGLDLHLGVGDDGGAEEAKLSSTVVPAELGASLFLGSAVSLDVLAIGELWLPSEYCSSVGGSSQCSSDGLHSELAWSALAGLTFHIH